MQETDIFESEIETTEGTEEPEIVITPEALQTIMARQEFTLYILIFFAVVLLCRLVYKFFDIFF